MAEVIKVCVLGDAGIGKTSLIKTWMDDAWPTDAKSVPKVAGGGSAVVREVNVDATPVSLHAFDSVGEEQYPGTDIFMLCYACDVKPSLEHVEEVWLAGIPPDAPWLLVGIKGDKSTYPWSVDDMISRNFVSRRGGYEFIKVSPKNEGPKDAKLAFEAAVRAALDDRKKLKAMDDKGRGGVCQIL